MRVKFTLYKKMVLLIVFVIFVSLLTAYSLILGITDTLVAQRMEIGSEKIASQITESKLVKENLINLEKKSEVLSFIVAISESTYSNIVIFNKDKDVLFLNSPKVDQKKRFLKEAIQFGFPEPINFSITNDLRIRSFYSKQSSKLIFDDKGNEIGVIVVEDLPSEFERSLVKESLFLVLLASLIGLVIGLFITIVLAKNVKDTLLGLEPEEIAQIMQERNAMLDSIEEGIFCVNCTGEIIWINSSAKRIFFYSGIRTQDFVGANVNSLYISDIFKVLTSGVSSINNEEMINNISVVTNIVPVFINQQIVGAITSLRLKTDVEVLAQQLTGVREYADALRAQTHEFLNKMHVILGLIETSSYKELREYIKGAVLTGNEESRYVHERIHDPVLSGFLIGKLSRARELAIEFVLTEESLLPDSIAQGHIDKMITIVGNLLNNAFDTLRKQSSERIVLLTILMIEDELIITVEDSGPGIPENLVSKIMDKGFSTKGENRGYGLNLVRRSVEECEGSIEIESIQGEGTTFVVKIPYRTIKNEV